MYYIIKNDICVYNTITIKDASDYINKKGYRIIAVHKRGEGAFIEVF